jgi:hypothetical protein
MGRQHRVSWLTIFNPGRASHIQGFGERCKIEQRPILEITALFDHIVGAAKQRERDGEPDRMAVLSTSYT